MAEVRRKAELLVRFHGVGPVVLQRVGLDLVVQADAAPFLAHVEEDAPACFGDGLYRHLALHTAVAPQAAEHVAGEALAVDANQHRLLGADVAEHERDVLRGVDRGAVGEGAGGAVLGREPGLGNALDEALMLEAIGDDVGDGDDVDAELPGDFLQLRHAGHRSVGVHDLADDRARRQSGHPGEVDAGLGLARSDEHPARLSAEREDMPGPGEVGRLRAGFDERLHGGGAVVHGDTRTAVVDVHGDGEGGGVLGGVVRDHHVEVELAEAVAGHRRADEPASVGRHEVDGLGRDPRGGDGEVPLVLPVLVVHDDDEFAGAEVLYRLFNTDDRHAIISRRAPGRP